MTTRPLNATDTDSCLLDSLAPECHQCSATSSTVDADPTVSQPHTRALSVDSIRYNVLQASCIASRAEMRQMHRSIRAFTKGDLNQRLQHRHLDRPTAEAIRSIISGMPIQPSRTSRATPRRRLARRTWMDGRLRQFGVQSRCRYRQPRTLLPADVSRMRSAQGVSRLGPSELLQYGEEGAGLDRWSCATAG